MAHSLNFEIHAGEIVMYYPSENNKDGGWPAVLTEVNRLGIANLTQLQHGNVNRRISGVRHITDPSLKDPDNNQLRGAWDLTVFGQQYRNLNKRLEALETSSVVGSDMVGRPLVATMAGEAATNEPSPVAKNKGGRPRKNTLPETQSVPQPMQNSQQNSQPANVADDDVQF